MIKKTRTIIFSLSARLLSLGQFFTISGCLPYLKDGCEKLDGRNIAHWMLSAFLGVLLKACGERSDIFEVGSRSI